jgi:DNA helicase HerA-like ATPase
MTTPSPDVFEKLSSFYLGRHFDLDQNETTDALLMYDAKDLCTHAMCVGMTGSGKTGLCIALLEEAAIDGIPAICVDPKGDLANLLLTFPDLRPQDFEPWLEQGEADRKQVTLDELAAEKADLWRTGLAAWGQDAKRIQKLKDAVDVAIYTPGSNIGLPLTVLKSFDAPPETRDDLELIGDRVTGSVSGLLTLLGISADPMTSPEHILLSSIISHQWREGKDVGVAQLIRLIQSPPLSRIGVVDLDSFMSPDDRGKLAMRLNNLLASPAFAPWLEGERLSIKRLLYTPEGKPRLTILSIAHLNDSERMFFVTILLNELVAWMRAQRGTSSLRAIFYMDEVAGFFPPVSNPPSKPPMLTLLKQARAYGLGITLATQNPVDLDYKGLSNIGTWFLGRLQTERDKLRVLEGLEGAAGQAGQKFDRGLMERTLAGLRSRVFLMNNVHDGFPVVFESRWAMSYLAGPLARAQISKLMADRKAAIAREEIQQGSANSAVGESVAAAKSAALTPQRPVLPIGVEELFIAATLPPAAGAKLIYRPALYGEGSMHFVRAAADLDTWRDARRIVLCHHGVPSSHWEASEPLPADIDFIDQPTEGYTFASLSDELLNKGSYRTYKSQLKEYLYRHCHENIYRTELVKGYAPAGDKSDAIAYFSHRIKEARDLEIEKLRDKHESRIKSIQDKINKADARIDRERMQSRTSWISAGSSVLGSLLGGFLGGRRAGVSTIARGIGHATQQDSDVRLAEQAHQQLVTELRELEQSLSADLEKLHREYDIHRIELEAIEIAPRKGDLKVEEVRIVWQPWQIDATGIATPLFGN